MFETGLHRHLLQEQACTLLAQLFTSVVRDCHDAPDAASKMQARAEAARVRQRAFRGGAVAAVVAAMHAHAAVTEVMHGGCLVLWALCESREPDATEGRHQAVEAGVLELIASALICESPTTPLCVWNTGRAALMALIRDEPALRRRAKRALPRFSLRYSLFALSL